MILNAEQLEQKAHELALVHNPSVTRPNDAGVIRAWERDMDSLRQFTAVLKADGGVCTQPAEQWLLDHADFIEKEALVVQRELKRGLLRKLTWLKTDGRPRALAIGDVYYRSTNGLLTFDSLTAFLNAYQEIAALTLAEAWSMPVLLRIAAISRLADLMRDVRERHEACARVERLLKSLGPPDTKLHASAIKEALERQGDSLPLSGAVLVHLISHLSEWAEDAGTVREWLICKLDTGTEHLNRIVTYEHQLQAAHEVECGHLIGSIRTLSRGQWKLAFEQISVVERTLITERSGAYRKLDEPSKHTLRQRVEQLASRFGVPENLIASQAIELADMRAERYGSEAFDIDLAGDLHPVDRSGAAPRDTFAAFYLLDTSGVEQLHQSLHACSEPRKLRGAVVRRRRGSAYAMSIGAAFILFAVVFMTWAGIGAGLTAGMWAAVIVTLLMPAAEWAITVGHGLIGSAARTRPLLRYDLSSGIPAEAKTLVVMPIIWSKPEEVEEMADRLELHYLANRDDQLYFALLGDYTDASNERAPGDEALLRAARERVARLNEQHPREDGGRTFHLFQRKRQWNEAENVWMGWERKRGKLVEFVGLLRGDANTSFLNSKALSEELYDVRYLITLDADTELPIGAAQRMIGTMHLPYNRPRLNASRTRVVEGYGVLQPRIGISYESVSNSRLARLWSGEPGIDPYAFAMSDPYQDVFGQGIFTGKGIMDIDAFAAVLSERIPNNTVLSHDLLEGGFLRGGLLCDIELIDGHPATFNAFQKRLHRWVRGDWQLLCWLMPRVCNRTGELQTVDLSPLTRWQIIDNLRRSALLPGIVALFLAAAFMPTQAWAVMTIVALLTVCMPIVRTLVQPVRFMRKPSTLLSAGGQSIVALVTLPYQTVLMIDAIGRTLFRMYRSRQRLLEWTSSAEVERRSEKPRAIHGLGWGIVIALAYGAVSFLSAHAAVRWTGVSIALIWLAAPTVVRWISSPPAKLDKPLSEDERAQLTRLAADIWSYFDRYAVESDNWLAPDNVQLDPPNGPARRTSPTNIGLQLACTLAARDFGFIETADMLTRMERTVDTIERMEKWKGHLYNWYETHTLRPLPPLYVSTVDSGNFVGYLITVKEGIAEYIAGKMTTGGKKPDNALRERGLRLNARLAKLINETEFAPLYDDASQLFTLGYHASAERKETILYDLLASEARQASFLAIAFGQAPAAHWFKLGRAMTKSGKDATLLSWSGTMFEYLMPALLMRTYRNTLWDKTYRGAVRRQIEYAKQRGVPFGISESGYYAFDYQMNYQYHAFGVPGLGFQRGLEDDLVLAPYAAIMALPYAKNEALESLRRMEEMGARGEHGYYEAIDCTDKRMPDGQRSVVIRSFMVHHQGMSLLTLANMLLPRTMVDRFHADKRVQAAELLLQERMPEKPALIADSAKAYSSRTTAVEEQERTAPLREFTDPITTVPEVCVLSNGSFSSVVSNNGGGFTRFGAISISRWREDPVIDPPGIGMYIRDVSNGAVWSPAYEPSRVASSEMRTQFSLHQASFLRKDGPFETELDICVSPEYPAEVRRIMVTNTSSDIRIVEITTYTELALAPPNADDAHPAFSKLFVQTEYDADAECLLAVRRPRDSHEKPRWAIQSLSIGCDALGPIEYETDRACFIGRGHTLQHPQSLSSRLSGTVGAVLDPIFAIRRRVSIGPGEQVKLFAITGTAESREEALSITQALCGEQQIERTFQLAWTHSRIDLRHQRLTAHEASLFHTLAGRILYPSPLRPERAESIAANGKGQSGLWSMGISGDLPIVLVTLEDRSQFPFAIRLMSGHGYLCRRGLPYDLVILNESAGGYQQDVSDNLRVAIEQNVDKQAVRPGGVYPVAANQLSVEERTLLLAVARVVLRADGPSLKAQLKGLAAGQPADGREALSLATEGQQTLPYAPPTAESPEELELFNGWGGFTTDGKEYRIILRGGKFLTAPWSNVMANQTFGFLVTELGTGYTWWRNSREFKLTPWSNDPVLDHPGEACYIRDERTGVFGSPTPAPASADAPCIVSHGRGYTRFNKTENGLKQQMTVYVPKSDPVKIVELTLDNVTDQQRELSVSYVCDWVLGVKRSISASHIVTEWDAEAGAMLVRNAYQETFRDDWAFLRMHDADEAARGNDLEESGTASRLSFTSDRAEWLGRGGTPASPEAMKRERLSGFTGVQHDACGAVQLKVTVEPGASKTVYVLLGAEHSREGALAIARKYSQAAVCRAAFAEVVQFWEETTLQTKVATPNKEMNYLLNGWLLYQALCCRMWARTAFYQAGGAFGYRDQLQDSLSMLHARPDITRAQIVLHAAHQYEEGDVQHWWHEETERGIRTKYSDDLLWLPYTAARYITQTADATVLDEIAPYLTSAMLTDEEHERYEATIQSEQRSTVYEHCVRAIERASRFGENGLPLMGIGDWNDGMNSVGDLGKGESVWLGWFLCEVLRQFAEVCDLRGDAERAETYRNRREAIAAAIDKSAWDGEWYRRARTDEGNWLGSTRNEECRIDAIAQSWSVISGAAPKEKAQQAMASFDRELVDRDIMVARLLTPPFDRTDPSPGYIQGYPPGLRENGAQYTHGVIWSIVAWCGLGNGDKAMDLFHLLNPVTHARSESDVRKYAGEPYVMAADVYTRDPVKGRAGWTWYTGASGWMYQAGLEWIIGLRRRSNRLYFNPAVPREWPSFEVEYRYGKTVYHIKVKLVDTLTEQEQAMPLDIDAAGDLQPHRDSTAVKRDEHGSYIELVDRGGIQPVEMTLPRAAHHAAAPTDSRA
ncbi:glycosyltransferase 36 [Paenibacillus curdlanolyticus YK9]|uniref:Glycosyltransferase 36 n=1 Tax=Paenibacillus curdlanolyticus YK9 TaxID=717606 RepID=E0IE35_9BACL|nr:glucoamylase family protein [Paenibacillus curdlanolyticus]EFM09389.1 glycosyltransferase 36 [Paenibacillus curdlanolyticus YK9]